MREYLVYRTPAEKQKISLTPSPLDIKDSVDYPISITLRRNGRAVANGFSRGSGLINNALAASIKALRCPGLGDKVTPDMLDSLAIEMEIMGPEIKLAKSQVAKNIIPSLTGVKLSIGIFDHKSAGTPMARAYQESRVSPATQYIKGYSPEDSVQQALRGIEDRPQSRNLRSAWSIYRAMHFVDYPKSPRPEFLYRGKILQLRPSDTLFFAHIYYAIRNTQEPQSEIVMPNNRQGHLWENAYLAYALKKAARNLPNRGDAKLIEYQIDVDTAANLIMSYFAKQFISLNDGKIKLGMAEQDNPLLSAAFLLLTSQLDKPVEKTEVLRKSLREYLRSAIDDKGKVLSSTGKEVSVLTQAVLLNALVESAKQQGSEYDKSFYHSLDCLLARCGILNSPTVKSVTPNIEELSWAAKVIIQADPAIQQQYLPYLKKIISRLVSAQQKYAKVLDQTGGIIEPTGGMTAAGTSAGMSVFIKMSKMTTWPQAGQAINLASDFCWMITYRPGEAYFAANPNSWTGWVRSKPSAAEISIHATASVINALADKMKMDNKKEAK